MTGWARIRAELGSPHMDLSHEDLERFRGPIAASHEKLRDFAPGDRLVVWRGPADIRGLDDLERKLIAHLEPRYNKPPGGDPCPDCGGRWRLGERSAGRCKWCQRRQADGLPPLRRL